MLCLEWAEGNSGIMTIIVLCLLLRRRQIEELSQSLAAQEKLVEQLSQEKQQLLHLLEEPTSMEVQVRIAPSMLP